MSETKHTPGPWKVVINAPLNVESSSKMIANCGCYQNNTINAEMLQAEQMANARLIAAAPALLDACKKQNEELAYAVDLLKSDAPVEWLAVIGNAQAVIATTKGA